MISINLISPTIKNQIRNAKQTVRAIRISIFLIILFVLASIASTIISSSVYTNKLESAKNNLAQEKAGLAKFDIYKNQALEINERVKIASQINAKRIRWSQVLQNLNNLTPQSISYDSLKTMTDKSPNLTLTAKSNGEINIILLQDKLKKSNFFKNVSFKNSAGPVNSIPFTLEFDLQNQSVITTKASLKK